jgi:NADH-quinone oxidoreductase subunit M
VQISGLPVLTFLIFLPLLGALPIAFFRRADSLLIRTWTLLIVLLEVSLATGLALAFDTGATGLQYVERQPWVPTLGIQYYVGVDGISLSMVVLTALLAAVAVVASWESLSGGRSKEYAIFLLFLEGGVIGSFLSLDLILFFAFWEAMLVPAYLLVGVCGGARRIYAAYKFFLYTAIGSLLMLVGIIWVYVVHGVLTGVSTFDAIELAKTPIPAEYQTWAFLAFALAFAIKIPIFPLHTWLPDLYTEMPLEAMVLVTMLVKVGAYGFLRFAIPLLPSAAVAYAPLLAGLGVVGIIYAGLCAFVQTDLVRVVAYSSIAHLGFIVLGIFALTHQSVEGAVVQMFNHGISAGLLFLVAAVIRARTGSTSFARLGGLAMKWPVIATFGLVAMLSSVGLPGLNGFVGEFLIIVGSYSTLLPYAVIASVGIVIAAIYLLSMYRQAMHGPEAPNLVGPDLSSREAVALAPLVVLIVVLGIYPALLLGTLENSVNQVTRVTGMVHTIASPQLVFQGLPALASAAGSERK